MKSSVLRRWVESLGRRGSAGRTERRRAARVLSLEALENRVVPSGTPELLKNVNDGTRASNPGQFTAVGSTIFFAASDSDHGRELWKTDGTAAGTAFVKDILPGSWRLLPGVSDEFPRDALLRGQQRDQRHRTLEERRHRRRHRPRQGHPPRPQRLQSLQPDGHRQDAVLHGQRRGERRGVVEERRHRRRHRPGQGHPPRQRRLEPHVPHRGGAGRCSSRPTTGSTAANCGRATARPPAPSSSRTSGRATPLRVPAELQPPRPDGGRRPAVLLGRRRGDRPRAVGATAPPPAPSWSRTSAPAAATYGYPLGSNPENLTAMGGRLFFAADDGVHGEELWKSDGTAAGTVLVEDIRPGEPRLVPERPDRRGRTAVLHGRRRGARYRALAEQRHGPGHRVWSWISRRAATTATRTALTPTSWPRWGGRCSSPPTTGCTAGRSGRATARPRAPSCSRTSTRATTAPTRRT